MSTLSRGTEVELMVATELVKIGCTVCLPLNHENQYDLVVDNGKRLLKVQAKRAYIHSKGRPNTLCAESRRVLVKHSGDKRSVVRTYDDDGYDFLIACNVSSNEFWIIPRNETKRYKAQVYLTTKAMSLFKNQWSLLECDCNQQLETTV
jgi:hypothetical protein